MTVRHPVAFHPPPQRTGRAHLACLGLLVMFTVGPALAQQSTTGPVPPPGLDQGWRPVSRSQVVIPDVPAYVWHHGCGPTALGMVVGYWDGQGFPDLVAGSASNQAAAVNTMIADDRGQADCSQPDGDHYQDYSCPLDNAPGPLETDRSELGGAHAHNCLGDFMKTSFSLLDNYYGWSWYADVDNAFSDYVASISPDYVATTLSRRFAAYSWAEYTAEIDAGRPLVLLVDTDGDGSTDHFVTAIGYDDTALEYGVYHTWDRNIHWYDWQGMSPGQPWGIYGFIACGMSDPQFTCCIGEECQILSEVDCLAAGGVWHAGHATCDPNPCADYACCFGDDTCQVLLYSDCVTLGGSWLDGIQDCDPNPCPEYACCIGGHCYLRNLRSCQLSGGEWHPGVESCDPYLCLPDSANLSGGVLLTQAPPGMVYTSGQDWCQRFADEGAIAHSYQQVSRIDPDPPDQVLLWFVLAAWEEPKEWCRATFGFADYDPEDYAFLDYGPCHYGGVEAASSGWPGPQEGTAILPVDRWSGNYKPLYWFAGYAYGQGQIPLCAYEYAGESGLLNCRDMAFDLDCYGALGLFSPGVACHPEGQAFACCIGASCTVLTEGACQDAGGIWLAGTAGCDPDPCSSQGLSRHGDGIISPRPQMEVSPNPATGRTQIAYRVPAAMAGQPLRLTIHDLSGRLVVPLRQEAAVEGMGTIEWDGCDRPGHHVATGVYFCRLTVGETKITQRMLHLD